MIIIIVNGHEMNWREDYSVADLLSSLHDRKDVYPLKGHSTLIIVNNEVLSSLTKYDYVIQQEDELKILPLLGGG